MAKYPSGISFPFRFNAAGSVAKDEGVEKVKSNLRMLITSPVNSRLVRKDVGTVSFDQVFRNLKEVGFGPVKTMIAESIAEFEPRVRVVSIETTPLEDTTGTTLRIELKFLYRSSAELNSLQLEI